MQKKVIVLNSGGFDSVVLAKRVRQIYPDVKIYNLFFDYGQPNLVLERSKSINCAMSIDAEFSEVKLTPFFWTKGSFYKGTSNTKNQYVEYRNLVFLAYATSLAESLECDRIFMATHFFSEGFKDGNNQFIDAFNETISQSGIRVETPFAYMYKDDLMNIVHEHSITLNDFYSCNNPKVDGTPCGECADCLAIKEMYNT